MKTAEWACTRCGTINRKLVEPGVDRAADRCVSCRTEHIIEEGDRPVRWKSTAKS